MQHALGDAALLQFGEVESGAEMIAIAGQHDGSYLFRGMTEPALQRKHSLIVERVAFDGPREMKDRNRVLQFHTDVS